MSGDHYVILTLVLLCLLLLLTITVILCCLARTMQPKAVSPSRKTRRSSGKENVQRDSHTQTTQGLPSFSHRVGVRGVTASSNSSVQARPRVQMGTAAGPPTAQKLLPNPRQVFIYINNQLDLHICLMTSRYLCGGSLVSPDYEEYHYSRPCPPPLPPPPPPAYMYSWPPPPPWCGPPPHHSWACPQESWRPHFRF